MSKQSATVDLNRAEFVCILAPVESAIKFAGDEGARIMLDIAESYKPEVVKLVTMNSKQLRCVITVERE
jgi:hypothetical protein